MFMTTSKLAIEFHSWLQDGAMSEEFFFATMSRVIQKEYRETGNVVQGKTILSFNSQNNLCSNKMEKNPLKNTLNQKLKFFTERRRR